MSNTYYKYSKSQTDKGGQPVQVRTVNMELSLTAYVGGSPNTLHTLQLTIQNSGDYEGTAYITLKEQEQNDLIAGILERRGKVFTTNEHGYISIQLCESISATGDEQSQIHPAQTDNKYQSPQTINQFTQVKNSNI